MHILVCPWLAMVTTSISTHLMNYLHIYDDGIVKDQHTMYIKVCIICEHVLYKCNIGEIKVSTYRPSN